MNTNVKLPIRSCGPVILRQRAWLPIAVSASLTLLGAAPALKAGDTTRVSVNSVGVEGNAFSTAASISTNGSGRYVAFRSEATNLVTGDGNGVDDCFVHDRQTGVTTRVSVDSAGAEGNGQSFSPSISADGRFVSFTSEASDLVPGDGNGRPDIFVHDRLAGLTTRASVDSTGAEGNGFSFASSISPDGRYVAFSSSASNLVPGDGNGLADVFVHDLQTGLTARVSVSSTGIEGNGPSQAPSISSNGLYAAFESLATNLVPGDGNSVSDVFVHNLQTGRTARVSVDSAGAEGDFDSARPSISDNGRYVAFASDSTNLVSGDGNAVGDCFVHDLRTSLTTRVSVDSAGAEGNFVSDFPSISDDGRYVAFASLASNLVTGDGNGQGDVFTHDRQTGLTTRVSVDSAGVEGNFGSSNPSISADGRHVAFESAATNLVAEDGNGAFDCFVHFLN